jgi:proteasome component ECM29
VKHQLDIGLPLSDLWKLYIESSAAPMVKNFCIVYIEMAFERSLEQEKVNLAPDLVANISKLPPQHQDIVLRISANVMGECHSVKVNDEISEKYKTISGSEDRKIFLEFCLHFVLYQLPQGGACPPGLSITQSERITGKRPLKPDMLLKIKLGILNVVQAMDLGPEVVYSIYVAACADSQEPVLKRGEELLKKASGVNLDDANLIGNLFLLFNGTGNVPQIPVNSRVTPGNPTLRIRLMSIFCRSITAANNFPSTLQCIFGCIYGIGTTSRLKQLGMEFTVWVFKHARMDQLKLMGPVILNGIIKSLDESASESDAVVRDAKIFAYQAIGLLAHRMPQLYSEKVDMAVRLFNALKSESQFIRLTVQEATNAVAIAYKGAPKSVLTELESLLLEKSHAEQSEVRFSAVRWATSLFDLQHCPSRYICMLSASDAKLDIREMALEGLFPGKDKKRTIIESTELEYPTLGKMLDYIFTQQPALLNSSEVRETNLIVPSKMYLAMISFLLKCFEADVGRNNLVEINQESRHSVERLCLILEHAMAYEGSVELHANACKALVTVGSHFPEMIASRYAEKISWLKQFLGHVDLDTRESVARLLGIASCSLPISDVAQLISELISSISGTQKLRFEIKHGDLSAVGYVTANSMSRTPTISESLFQNVLSCLVDIVNSETATLASVAMQALGHIGLCVPLPLLPHESTSAAILEVVSEKLTKLLSGDDIKPIQKIVISLGHMCVKESSSSHLSIALDLIFSLSRSKVEDILFAAGEALSFLWGGVPVTSDMILKTTYTSLSMSSNFLMGDVCSNINGSKSTEYEGTGDFHVTVRDAVTRQLFDVLLYSTRKEERCAGTVWLLSLTMYCGQHPTVQKLLPEIQEAFSHLIGEQNELTQELASQGLSIVYEIGDSSMKKNLVNALVGTLTGSGKRKRAVKLAEDTEVFQEGAIGGTLSGGKLSTYKELCNLANEMGQPDMIYKFMDLANYQASLNSKRGAAFGFSKIAKLAGDALKPHLRLLIPRLVRYLYDPDKNVQDAMAHIWKSLVADSKRTIDDHLDLIIEDLLQQCGSRLWRSREASCLAIADVIQGRKFDQVGKHLKKVWTAAFRAMDDIKETVRIAGDKLCRAISSLTIRLCDVSLTDISDARQTMDIVLPLFLAEGIMSKVDSIRKASIGMVTKLAKGAGTAIRPHLPALVCCMLEGLSSLEDQGLNYVEMHAANVGIQTEKLENLRISIAKGSPMWETLDLCIDAVDDQSLEQLVPRLAQLARSGVGLNTRVGVASFISLLVQKVGVSIKPFTGSLLKLLFPVVKEEKSASSKRAFANACAIVLKYATPSQTDKLIEDTAALHTGDRNCQIACALLLKSYSSAASDVLSGYHATVVPVIFLSRFDDDKNVASLYEELWEENMSSERVTLQLYLGEIVTLITDGMTSSSWISKKKAAQGICKLSEVLGESLSLHHDVLLTSLMKELPGRLWEGKESLLLALAAICTSCGKAISSANPSKPEDILSLVTSACKKKDKKYREAAFTCLEKVIKAFDNPKFFNIVFPLLFEICTSTSNSSQARTSNIVSKPEETEEKEETSGPNEKILDCLTACIQVAHIADITGIHKNNLLLLFSASLAPAVRWIVKMSVFTSLKELCTKIQKESDENSSLSELVNELFHLVSPKIVECISTIKIAQVHVSASDCLLEMIKLYEKRGGVLGGEIGFKEELVNQWEIERNGEAKSQLKKCIDLLQNLNTTMDST